MTVARGSTVLRLTALAVLLALAGAPLAPCACLPPDAAAPAEAPHGSCGGAGDRGDSRVDGTACGCCGVEPAADTAGTARPVAAPPRAALRPATAAPIAAPGFAGASTEAKGTSPAGSRPRSPILRI